MMMLKGAPEKIVAMCTTMYTQNKVVPITKV